MAIIATSCGEPKEAPKALETDNALTTAEIAAGILSPEVIWKMGRVGEFALSPDGEQVVFGVTRYNMAENRGVTSLWLQGTAGGDAQQITDNTGSESNPQWSNDGKLIYFLSDRSGSSQLWSSKPDGTALTQLSHLDTDIENFGIAPSGNRIFYIQRVKVEQRASSEIYPDLDKSRAHVYDELMVRHWNRWTDGTHLHIFVATFDGGKLAAGSDIMAGEPWDAPMEPYFDAAEIAWNNAGTQLAYTSKKMGETEYAVSTDSDIYIYDLATGETVNLNKMNSPSDPRLRIGPVFPGYDRYPVFSPDDRRIAFQSMARPGNEADKERLMVWDSEDGSCTDVTANFDSHASSIVWLDNESIAFVSPLKGTHQVCLTRTNPDNNQWSDIQTASIGKHDIGSLAYAQGTAVVSLSTMNSGAELFGFDFSNGELKQLTDTNRYVYDNIKLGEVQERWIATTDGKQMLTYVFLPPGFDPAQKYPALLYCQGGPQSTLGWSYRWNFQMMAAQGYVVVAPCRRGVPGFGQEWIDQISGDYSGQNIRDYLAAIDTVAKEPWVDENRLGCVGASYGGYSAFYLAGVHQKRFKAFIAHCGIFNFESMYGSTEELFFVGNDYGGPYWSGDPTAKRSYANSPHKFVKNWDTPILIITGLNDFRIPYTQSLEAHTAARLMGVPSRLVAFENEAHQVFKPQNSLAWNREFFGWLYKYVKSQE